MLFSARNLWHDKVRLAVAIAGITFAVVLMFMQVGFQKALYDSQVRIVDQLRGDLFLTSRARFALAAEKRFPLARLYQARSHEHVVNAYPVYAEFATSILRRPVEMAAQNDAAISRSARGYPIRSIGFHLGDPVFRSPELNRQADKLRVPRTALIDVKSKPSSFDFPLSDDEALAGVSAELASKEVTLVGTFDLGADFVHDGNLVMSAHTFSSYFPYRSQAKGPLDVVDIGILELAEGAPPEVVAQQLSEMLGDEIYVQTRYQLSSSEKGFWQNSTPIGYVFTAGKVIGFIVGFVICLQVISSDISKHLPEFATLKAMGYGWPYFRRLILAESLWLAISGFITGALISVVLYMLLAAQTGLYMHMSLDSLGWVLLATVVMCVFSGWFAAKKLRTADPVSLF